MSKMTGNTTMTKTKKPLTKIMRAAIVLLLCVVMMPTAAFATTTSKAKPVQPALGAPNGSVLAASDEYLKVSWSKVEGASGYQIYRATSKKGTYNKIATVKAGVTKYNDRRVVENKKYYYKVRAYKRISADSLKFGKFSEPKYGIIRVSYIDFDDVIDDANDDHVALNTKKVSFNNLKTLTKYHPETVGLLGDKEVEQLLADNDINMVTSKQALEDINLYFRTLKSAYAGYYYFGEANFAKAEMEMFKWASAQKELISPYSISLELSEKLDFVKDAHFYAGWVWSWGAKEKFYNYYYSLYRSYGKDKYGYFTYLNGSSVKWYVKSFSDKRVALEKTLKGNGRLVYAPVLWCAEADKKDCTVSLKAKDGRTKKLKVTFTKAEPVSVSRDRSFKMAKANGMAYLSLKTFNGTGEYDLDSFVNSGSSLKDAKLIIMDLRGNNGGSDKFGRDWIANFTGKTVKVPQFLATRGSELGNEIFKRNIAHGAFPYGTMDGRMIKNDVPIIVLVDNMCGSAGENLVNYLKTLDNVLVVGSNTAGYQICGNVYGYSLPNSGMPFDFGTSLSMIYGDKNIDYKGYAPDVWCDPQNALDAVMSMLERNESKTNFNKFLSEIHDLGVY